MCVTRGRVQGSQRGLVLPRRLPDGGAHDQLEDLVFAEARCDGRRDVIVSDLGGVQGDPIDQRAQRLRQPCLLVRGAESDVLTIAVAREFVELAATATLVEVPRAAHMVAGDNSDAFTAAIRAWLDMLAAGTSPTLRRRAKFGLLWR